MKNTQMKYEWKNYHKELYSTKNFPILVNIPAQKFIMILGTGNPNDVDFSNKISALYSLAYAIKMKYKSNDLTQNIQDFSVYPL